MHGMTMALPSGSWTHSFEEDADGIEVYRPTATFAFPPSRQGRKVLEFGAPAGAMAQGEMTVTSMAPGPDDRPRAGPVTRLHPLGMGRYALSDASGTQEVIDIVEATPEVLRLSRR
ncbi:hypothetical protein O3301_21090 [Janthinobacterium sp. SUN211]|uniref:hypothetical protein n=1 Tax=Janthinobacterium sp. SUN211 TaxID=3014786 RepID=UPI00271367A5|nr:hypothetical protein [Janthinobacterium sp. SUN211]MDO8050967.1 hypothetical protein [Janthinobacterium sp. SUN211]